MRTDPRSRLAEPAFERESVRHIVKHMYAFQVDTGDRWTDRARTSGNNEAIVCEAHAAAVACGLDPALRKLDLLCARARQEARTASRKVLERAMSQASPIPYFAAEKEGQPANAEVRIVIGQEHRDLGIGLKLARTQGS